MNNGFAFNDKLILIQGDSISATTYQSATRRILGGSAEYLTPETLIDESFRLYNVIGEEHTRPKSGLWNSLKRLLSPISYVRLVFDGPSRQSNLEECRELIYRAMELDPEFHESSRPMEEWKRDFWLAQSFEELYLLVQCSIESNARFRELQCERLKRVPHE